MVYHGPSKGCRTCRKRRVKCDEGRPQCNNCIRRNVECPGYESAFDYRHRNETHSTILRAQHKGGTARRKPPPPSTSSEDSPATSLSEDVELLDEPTPAELTAIYARNDFLGCNTAVAPTFLYSTLQPDIETLTLNWYFSNYPWKAIDPQSSHGFMALVKPLYLASSDKSPLRPAVAAMASNLLMLFSHQGCDTALARRFYTQSITRMKDAIQDPNKSKEDDLVLTTLSLNFYDMVNLRWSHDLSNYNNHKNGAIALLKHRGLFNYRNERSKYVTSALRTAFCYWALDIDQVVDPEILKWFGEAQLPKNKANELDIITLRLIGFQARFRKLYESSLRNIKTVDQTEIKSAVEEGLALEEEFLDWERTIPSHWHPLYASTEDVLPSIRKAGLYGDRCAVYWDFSICDITNTCRIRRLKNLRMLRQLYIDTDDPSYGDDLASAEAKMQKLVDELCETVPSMLGDVTGAMHMSQLYEISYPLATNGVFTYPNPEHDHQRAAAASGGWLASALLVTLAKLGVDEGDLEPFPMRRGQFKWVQGQLGRMQKVFFLSQPARESSWNSYRRF